MIDHKTSCMNLLDLWIWEEHPLKLHLFHHLKEQITKHKEDLSTVTLRNINGETQTWDLFVATWLGLVQMRHVKGFLIN